MSLVNDALQRAKRQTTQPSTAPNLQLLPLEAEPRERKSFGVTFSIVLALAIVAALILITASIAQMGIRKTTRDVIASSTPLRPIATKVVQAEVAPKIFETESPAISPQVSDSAEASAPLPTVAEAPVVKPAPLKLQAVFYSAVRPSAMIAGKTVFVGDRVGGFQVAAITVNSATLVGEARTNILSFEE
ncbi:MAG: hypothetical protein ACTHLW_10765 [Verrucomicrobiota bacterium]